MNPWTGDLVDSIEPDSQRAINYERLPKSLEHAAKRKLKGKKRAVVSLTSGGKLSNWARKRRKEVKMKKGPVKRVQQSSMVKNCNDYYDKLRKEES
jgi:hypothetical protein